MNSSESLNFSPHPLMSQESAALRSGWGGWAQRAPGPGALHPLLVPPRSRGPMGRGRPLTALPSVLQAHEQAGGRSGWEPEVGLPAASTASTSSSRAGF